MHCLAGRTDSTKHREMQYILLAMNRVVEAHSRTYAVSLG